MDENIKKALTFLFFAMGLGIFSLVLLLKVDVWSKRVVSETKEFGAELDWEGFRYQQTARNLMKQ